MRLILAIKAFFKVLFNRQLAESFRRLSAGEQVESPQQQPKLEAKRTEPSAKPKPGRSDAISLLAALQREARLIDIVKEPLSEYSDAQIGAAARDVLRDTEKVLNRLFEIRPLTDAAEGSEMETPADFDAGRYRLTGNVAGDPPFKGSLAHHGWEAAKCEVPQWSGSDAAKNVIAPIELEIA